MKLLDAAHRYELENFEAKDKPGQILQFIHKELDETSGEFRTVNDGTTDEEVIAALIDRIEKLNEKVHSRFNDFTIAKLKEAKFWLNERKADRHRRGVEGTPNK